MANDALTAAREDWQAAKERLDAAIAHKIPLRYSTITMGEMLDAASAYIPLLEAGRHAEAQPTRYELDYAAYAEWYQQMVGRETPFEQGQLFVIGHEMGKLSGSDEDYVYAKVASVPGCAMPKRFLKAWTPEPDEDEDAPC